MCTTSKTLQSKNLFFSCVDDGKVHQKNQIENNCHDTKIISKNLPYLSNLFSYIQTLFVKEYLLLFNYYFTIT